MGEMSGLIGLGLLGLLLALAMTAAGFIASRKHKQIDEEHGPDAEFIDVGGTRLHYRQTGDTALPAVLVMETLRRLDALNRCEPVGYATSAEASGDTSRVVGYAGMLFA